MTIKWTSIESFHHLVRGFKLREQRAGIPRPTITYRGKIKLDGTNAAVRCDPRHVEGPGIHAQSRTRDITVTSDNTGFAAWVDENCNYFLRLRDAMGKTIIVFGEWCGKGIQKRCAISKIDRKVFAVFAIEAHFEGDTEARILVDPDLIRRHLPEHPDIYVIPWHDVEDVTVDYSDRASMEAAVDTFNARIAEIEPCDPWVRDTFGVEGLAEGVVYYPLETGVVGGSAVRDHVTRGMFKAKGEKHKVTKERRPTQVDPVVLENTAAFVKMFVTDNRCEQGVTAVCNDEYDKRYTGAFLKWIGGDVRTESVVELDESGLTWKQVAKAVNAAAKGWYFAKADSF